jgi:hypothetical protein
MPVTKAPKVTWRAGRDRVAHAHTPRATRTICGEPVVAENLSWPELRHCMVCTAALTDNPGLGL